MLSSGSRYSFLVWHYIQYNEAMSVSVFTKYLHFSALYRDVSNMIRFFQQSISGEGWILLCHKYRYGQIKKISPMQKFNNYCRHWYFSAHAYDY